MKGPDVELAVAVDVIEKALQFAFVDQRETAALVAALDRDVEDHGANCACEIFKKKIDALYRCCVFCLLYLASCLDQRGLSGGTPLRRGGVCPFEPQQT